MKCFVTGRWSLFVLLTGASVGIWACDNGPTSPSGNANLVVNLN